MRVAVLGGGLQGCCTALALAERGASVTLYDRNAALVSRASLANEGKIHLGYVYAADPSLATARLMIEGALVFAPLIERYLGEPVDLGLSTPFAYAVHRDSLLSVEQFDGHLRAIHDHLAQAEGARRGAYFGREIALPRRLTAGETGDHYDTGQVAAVFQTSELAINSLILAGKLRARIAAEPAIALRLGAQVLRVDDGDGAQPSVMARCDGAIETMAFDHVVNALWDGRLAIDAGRGDVPDRPWLHRLKYGVRFSLPATQAELPSLTIVLGRFGDTVRFADGSYYLSWYPAGMRAKSGEIAPPDWPTEPGPEMADGILAESFAGMGAILPQLAALDPASLRGARVLGGSIFAWGSTDIDDRGSLLHQRYRIGVASSGRYHSIDTGKLTMAPYFAELCAERILPAAEAMMMSPAAARES